MAIITEVYDWSFVRLPKRFTLPFLGIMFLFLGFVFPYMIDLIYKTLPNPSMRDKPFSELLRGVSTLPSNPQDGLVTLGKDMGFAILLTLSILVLVLIGISISYWTALGMYWLTRTRHPMAGVKIHQPTLPEPRAHPEHGRPNPLRGFSRIGIILAGGGAKGTYQAGALKAIYEFLDVHNAHAKVHMIAGTSIGSWNAMFWLANLIKSPGEDLGLLEQWWSNVNVQDVISPVPYILFRQNYLLSNKPWQQTFDRFFIENKEAHERLLYHMQQPKDDQAIHFYFTRTNVAQGRLEFTTNIEDFTGVEDYFDLYPHVLSTELHRRRTLAKTVEDLRTAVFSSMDLPPLFSYMKIDEMDYEDGGVIDNLPIRFGTDIEKCDLLFVLPLNANFEAEPNLRSIIKRLVRVMNIRQGVLERNSFKKMYYHNRLVDIHQELYLLCSEIKKACKFEDHLSEIIARLQDINNRRKDTTAQEKELVDDVINQLQTKINDNKHSDRVNEIISHAKENDLRKAQVFSICPSAKLAVNTSEFWKTIEAGHAFRHMYRVTKTELENFDFEAEQSKIRMLLVDPYGESTWLEDFYF